MKEGDGRTSAAVDLAGQKILEERATKCPGSQQSVEPQRSAHTPMAAAPEPPPESVPQERSASGAEIAPLAAHDMRRDGAAAEPAEDPAARAEREVEEADELLRQYSGPAVELNVGLGIDEAEARRLVRAMLGLPFRAGTRNDGDASSRGLTDEQTGSGPATPHRGLHALHQAGILLDDEVRWR